MKKNILETEFMAVEVIKWSYLEEDIHKLACTMTKISKSACRKARLGTFIMTFNTRNTYMLHIQRTFSSSEHGVFVEACLLRRLIRLIPKAQTRGKDYFVTPTR